MGRQGFAMIGPAALPDPNAELTAQDLSRERLGLERERWPEDRNVAITGFETTVVAGNFPWVLVRVHTDAGVTGTGEAYWGAGVEPLVRRMGPFLEGENPLDLGRLASHLLARTSGEGSQGGATVAAIGGIELALHDLAGRLLDVPVYQLLGGKFRDEVRVYCDCHAGEDGSAEAAAAEAERVVDELGFDAVKFDLDTAGGVSPDPASANLSRAEIEAKAQLVEAVTRALGARAEAAFDCHWGFDVESARRLARRIEDLGAWWLEDPVPTSTPEGLARVREASSTPIAAGENAFRLAGLAPLVTEGAVDVLTPDLPKAGGFRETTRATDLAALYGVPVVLHNVCSPIGTMAAVHLAAARANVLAVEFHAYEVGWWADLVDGGAEITQGRLMVPEGPGLGVELDLEVVEEHRIGDASTFG